MGEHYEGLGDRADTLGFTVGFRLQGLGYYGIGLRASRSRVEFSDQIFEKMKWKTIIGCRFRIHGFRVHGLVVRVQGLSALGSGVRFAPRGLGFGVQE